jgi:hypothetical protein
MNSNTLSYYDRVVPLSMGSLRCIVSDGRWQSRAVWRLSDANWTEKRNGLEVESSKPLYLN